MTTMQRWEVTAAAMPVVLVRAWEALYDRVKLAAGQSVLIPCMHTVGFGFGCPNLSAVHHYTFFGVQ